MHHACVWMSRIHTNTQYANLLHRLAHILQCRLNFWVLCVIPTQGWWNLRKRLRFSEAKRPRRCWSSANTQVLLCTRTEFLFVDGGMGVSKRVSSSGCGVALGQVQLVATYPSFAYAAEVSLSFVQSLSSSIFPGSTTPIWGVEQKVRMCIYPTYYPLMCFVAYLLQGFVTNRRLLLSSSGNTNPYSSSPS